MVKRILGTSRLHKISITAPLADDYVTVIMRRGLYRIIKMKSRQRKAARKSNKSKSHPCISKPGRFNELTARLETQRALCSNQLYFFFWKSENGFVEFSNISKRKRVEMNMQKIMTNTPHIRVELLPS